MKIVNESGKDYYYVDKSLQVEVPAQNLDEPRETVYRPNNQALIALGLDEYASSRDLADAAVGSLLKEQGYGTGTELTAAQICVEYLDDYYLDYYNNTFKDPEAPQASSLSEVSYEYRQALFNDMAYSDVNGNWVEVPTQIRPDRCSNDRESNEEVNKLSYYHAYKDLLLLNKFPLLNYQDTASDEYLGFNAFLNQHVFAENGFDLEKRVLGTAANCYQNHVFYSDMSFTLALDGVKPEEKTSEPDLVKKITDGDKIIIDEGENAGDYATVDADGRVKFALTSHVGQDLAEVIKPKEVLPPGTPAGETVEDKYETVGTYSFCFVDNLDEELILDRDSIKVSVNGAEIELPESAIEIVSPLTEGDYAGRTQIKVSVDLVSLFYQGIFEYEDFGKAPIVMTYTAKVKDSANVNPGDMYNTAWVEYQDKQTQPDDVEVDTFGIKVFKYDQTSNKGLQGAEFELTYTDDEGNTVVLKAVSNAEGYVEFKGLKAGDYKLVETKAPAGYVKSDKSLPIKVNKDTDDDTYYVNVEFANAPEVHTGGSGTVLFTLGGGALLVIGAATYLISKNVRKTNPYFLNICSDKTNT
ncbi:SpaA isopeptide-forming pilin-related protein [Allobaculum sp. Allo2]|uniref:SpaA isopeptide-forming pilin-related protein n=1 Tax=Allobaculum sp. Allo2 TaxID=2853432 RepID=UPI001F60EDD1|nr:SpaA isopeptide-forming pilin-related protein [Allobaculum sp. Allo2]UNT94168.1 isopeptide-forming domain-containing fimbrial protein [Allobaculum sp. Allo2]